ncbi:MAG: hypothetical protein JKY52_00060 [Flavobacteriales bacterium]|nr:hypothetical protein [Flavobacteriales bacterium]
MGILTLKLDNVAGPSIREGCDELCRVATLLGVNTELNINGITTTAYPGTTGNDLFAGYSHAVKVKSTWAMARPANKRPLETEQ